MFSDKLSLLSDEQKTMLSYLFPQNKDAAYPLDIMENPMPRVLDCRTHGKIRTVILINWLDEDKTVSVDAAGCHVFEFWSRSYKGIFDGKYEATLKPHCCEVLFLTETGVPAVIGTDSALIPDIKQEYSDGKLAFSFEKKDETVYVYADGVRTGDADVASVGEKLFAVTQTGDCLGCSLEIL